MYYMVFLYNGCFGCLPGRGASKIAPTSEYYRNPATVHPTHLTRSLVEDNVGHVFTNVFRQTKMSLREKEN
jgi:hypothetical protein